MYIIEVSAIKIIILNVLFYITHTVSRVLCEAAKVEHCMN